jgi:AcrR family transcriptional regulator
MKTVKTEALCPPSTDTAGASPLKRQQIIDGANRVFAKHGFEGASMSQIAREAQVSKGTLYNYFDSKVALFSASVEQAACEKLPALFENFVDAQADCATALHALAASVIRMHLAETTLTMYRIIVAEAEAFPHLAESFWTNGPEKALARLAAWLAEQTRQGALDIEDPAFAAEQFFTLCQTRIATRKRLHLPVASGPADIERIARSSVTMFLRTYRHAA